jgi:hypothetical protein
VKAGRKQKFSIVFFVIKREVEYIVQHCDVYFEPKGAVQTGVQPTSPKIPVQVEDDKGGAGNSLREAIKQA